MTTKIKCHECKWKKDILGDCHVTCTRPIPDMKVSEHGLKNGWAYYPFNFDPIWLKPPGGECRGFIAKDAPRTSAQALRDITSNAGPFADFNTAVNSIEDRLDRLGVPQSCRLAVMKDCYHLLSTVLEQVAVSFENVEKKRGDTTAKTSES